MNVFVGCVQNIVYRSPTALLVRGTLKPYISIDFPKCFIWEYHNFLSDKTCTSAPLYMAKFQREN